ncbi:MAG: methyltransferase [Candidatus Bathyarchaeia archaeon]
MSRLSRKYGYIVIILTILFLVYVWTSKFGANIPSSEGYVPLLKENAWYLVYLGLIATAFALVSLFLEFKLSSSAAFVGWIFYFPVLFNTLVPMFILFFSIIGVFYTPWLVFTDWPLANSLINGVIRFQSETLHTFVDGLGYTFIFFGLIIYSVGLFQLLSHAREERTIMTNRLYSISRHPQYLGIFMWTLGFAMIGWRLINYLMWLTLCYSYTLLAEFEESELEKKFGQNYVEYKTKVPFMLPCLKVNTRLVSNMLSNRKIRFLAYTILYVLLLFVFYFIFEPYVVLYR